jgi:hypothetical protein
MCHIPTVNPDSHVEAILSHMVLNAISVLGSIRSIINKSMLDAHYLRDLSSHDALVKPMPELSAIREKAVAALKEQRGKWKSEEEVRLGKYPNDRFWDISDDVIEKLADWALIDLLSQK